jgi:hypothetical protein
MEKYSVGDVTAQQRAELEQVRRQLRILRGFMGSLALTKEASAEIRHLEERQVQLEQAVEEPQAALPPQE